jgi:hypothetical protein
MGWFENTHPVAASTRPVVTTAFVPCVPDNGERLRCGSCNELLPVSAFSLRRASSTGRQSYCKLCQQAVWKDYRNTRKQRAKAR